MSRSGSYFPVIHTTSLFTAAIFFHNCQITCHRMKHINSTALKKTVMFTLQKVCTCRLSNIKGTCFTRENARLKSVEMCFSSCINALAIWYCKQIFSWVFSYSFAEGKVTVLLGDKLSFPCIIFQTPGKYLLNCIF